MTSGKSGCSSKSRRVGGKASPSAAPEVIEAVPCAIYSRSAIEENPDPEKHAVAIQQQHCLRTIWGKRSEGWVHRVTLSDPNCSGISPNRLGLQLLLSLAKAHQIKVVVVQKRERLGRDIRLVSAIETELSRHGVKIYSCIEGMRSDSPLNHLFQLQQLSPASAALNPDTISSPRRNILRGLRAQNMRSQSSSSR